MKPPPTEVLAFLARMMPDYAREAGSPYLRKQLSTATGLLSMMAQDLDRLVPRLLEEATAIRSLFAASVAMVEDRALAEEIGSEAALASSDFHLSALFADNDRLRELLVRLHAHVETLTGDGPREIDNAIWRELAKQGERRRTTYLKTGTQGFSA